MKVNQSKYPTLSVGLSFSCDELPYKWSIIGPFIRPFSIRILFAYESFCLAVKLLTAMTRYFSNIQQNLFFFSSVWPSAAILRSLARICLKQRIVSPSFCTSIFNISGEFIEVFFHNLFNYGLVGGVWFYFFITYREMKVRLHFQFLAYKAGWLIALGSEWQ